MHNNNSRKNLDIITVMDMLEPEMTGKLRGDFEFFVINHVLLDSISRLAKHRSPDRDEIIRKLRRYVREKIPRLSQCESYKKESFRRRFIMRLNYCGFEKLGQLILKIKKAAG